MEFVYGSTKRIFVNTSIGCMASCQYCYLPSLKNNKNVDNISSDKAIKLVEEKPYFVTGENGTIISIGCYSECLDKDNILNTKSLLKHFTPKGNYIQLATKQLVTKELLATIVSNRVFNQQVIIYVSMPTISHILSIEKRTAPFEIRMNNIKECVSNDICVVLYIKPYLHNLTSEDVDKYLDIIDRYNIPVVIGSYLSVQNTSTMADVGEQKLYEMELDEEYDNFLMKFKNIQNVYYHSIEVINYFRKLREES